MNEQETEADEMENEIVPIIIDKHHEKNNEGLKELNESLVQKSSVV